MTPWPRRNVPKVPQVPQLTLVESFDSSVAVGNRNGGSASFTHMSTVVRKRSETPIADGVYRAVIADVEPNVQSRFSSRDDLVRIAFDLVQESEGQRPRLWLVTSPILR